MVEPYPLSVAFWKQVLEDFKSQPIAFFNLIPAGVPLFVSIIASIIYCLGQISLKSRSPEFLIKFAYAM